MTKDIIEGDVTYIFYDKGVCYLSVILDAYTREILAYELSENLEVTFVLNTVSKLMIGLITTITTDISGIWSDCRRKNTIVM